MKEEKKNKVQEASLEDGDEDVQRKDRRPKLSPTTTKDMKKEISKNK